jgi:hypothetical protein
LKISHVCCCPCYCCFGYWKTKNFDATAAGLRATDLLLLQSTAAELFVCKLRLLETCCHVKSYCFVCLFLLELKLESMTAATDFSTTSVETLLL